MAIVVWSSRVDVFLGHGKGDIIKEKEREREREREREGERERKKDRELPVN